MSKNRMGGGIPAGRLKLQQMTSFLNRDVWDLDLATQPFLRGTAFRLLRVVMLVFKGFRDDECSMHASALTFSTLMAIVPIMALCLSMARGLGDADSAKRWVQNRVQAWTETFKVETAIGSEGQIATGENPTEISTRSDFVQNELAMRINSLVEKGFEKADNINFARLGTAGLVLLIWMVVEVLGRVERSFNRVWGVVKGRSMLRRFTDYLSVLLILPVLIVAAASLPVMDIVTQFMPNGTVVLIRQLASSGLFKHVVVMVMTTLAFTFIIMFMPNTRMKVHSGLSGGFVSAVLFLLWLWICAMVQVGAARYGKIYGSFAVAPIVLAWVHVSWQIVLFGAEVAFSVENCNTFRMEQSAGEANIRARMTLALSVITEAARSMTKDIPPFDLIAYGKQRRIPVRFLQAVVGELVQAGYMAPITEQPGLFALLKAPGMLPVQDILNMMMNAGAGSQELGLTQVDPRVQKAVEQAFSNVAGEWQNQTVGALLKETDGGEGRDKG